MEDLNFSSDGEYMGGRTPKRPIRSKKIVVPVKRGQKNVSLSINVVPKSPRRKRARSPARRNSPFMHPFAFIDVNYRLLVPKEGKEFLFTFDHLMHSEVLRGILGTTVDEIGQGFLIGYFLTFDSVKDGYPAVHFETDFREAVNGVLYEVTSDQIAKLRAHFNPTDYRHLEKIDVTVPGKGVAKASMLMPLTSGLDKRLHRDAREHMLKSNIHPDWRKKIEDS